MLRKLVFFAIFDMKCIYTDLRILENFGGASHAKLFRGKRRGMGRRGGRLGRTGTRRRVVEKWVRKKAGKERRKGNKKNSYV